MICPTPAIVDVDQEMTAVQFGVPDPNVISRVRVHQPTVLGDGISILHRPRTQEGEPPVVTVRGGNLSRVKKNGNVRKQGCIRKTSRITIIIF